MRARDCYELSRVRRTIINIVRYFLIIGVPYLAFVLLTDIRIPCMLYEMTGFLCPGCGATRMFVSLAHLRFFEAYSYNRAFFLLLFYWCAVALFAFIGKPRLVRSKGFLVFSFVAMTVFLTIFGILRNIY